MPFVVVQIGNDVCGHTPGKYTVRFIFALLLASASASLRHSQQRLSVELFSVHLMCVPVFCCVIVLCCGCFLVLQPVKEFLAKARGEFAYLDTLLAPGSHVIIMGPCVLTHARVHIAASRHA